MTCFQCQHSTSNPDHFSNGWRLRSGEHARLCQRCFLAYEEGRFCETFHSNDDGWRKCESCDKLVHCGCIVSFNNHFLTDSGGIICMKCTRLNFLLTRNHCVSLEHGIRAGESQHEPSGKSLVGSENCQKCNMSPNSQHYKELPGILKREPVTVRNVNLSVSSTCKFDLINPFINAFAAVALVATPMANAVTMESIAEQSNSLYNIAADGSAEDWLSGLLYSAGQQANVAVQDQLSALSFTSLAVIFGAGLVTSLSPCTLSVLPLTLGYIGAFGSGKSRTEVIGNSIAFAMGLATTLALLGVAASFAGKAYGQIGQGLPVAASVLAVVMGLNLLEIIEVQLPSFFNNFDPRAAAVNFPSSVQAYLAGLTFALAASPCSTPVLASLLGYVASTRNPVIGGSLLLTYTTGYVAPLLLAASFAGALQSLLSLRKFSAWINPMSGALLLGGGVYTLLDRLFPATMAM